jgi:hypothetical protein
VWPEVGLALLVILDRLNPAERIAFVLHDMFAVSFEEIGSFVGCPPMAARQLASRAPQGARSGHGSRSQPYRKRGGRDARRWHSRFGGK